MNYLLMTYIENTSYFQVAPPGYNIASKYIDYILKNDKYISLFVIQTKKLMFEKY